MRLIFKHINTIALFIGVCFSINAQDNKSLDTTSIIIPPLDVVIEAAIRNSPTLKVYKLQNQELKQELKVEKKSWSDYVYLEGSTNYGLYDQVVINNVTGEETYNTGSLIKNEQIRYYSGISVKLPLSAIISRGNNKKIGKLKIEQSEQEYLQVIKHIKHEAIEEYYKLLYLEESMRTFQMVYNTLEISLKKTEKEFVNGRKDLEDYALLASTVGKARDEYYKAQNAFYAQYHIIQNLTGILLETNNN